MESHLLQMRGLKLSERILDRHTVLSHLLQMRGLKLVKIIIATFENVASFTDAWIETG